ncbi:MAG: DUF5107 domain-containing protein [Anaerolineae bacterium]|jgi:LysM repeat protein
MRIHRLALVTIAIVLLIPLLACSVVISGSPPDALSSALPSPASTEVVEYATSVPTYTPTAAPSPTELPSPTVPAPTVEPTATPEPPTLTPAPSPEPGLKYTVAKGDTLSEIAAQFDTTVAAIVAANGLADPNRLEIGQELIIPGADATVPPAPAPTQPPALATPVPGPSPAPQPTAAASAPAASVREGTITLNIADYEAALVPLRPEQVGYPYDGLDFDQVGAPAPRQFRALILENAYLEVTILPDLGGRIYQITDKVNGRPLLYNNPATIASTWGMRGWWLAAGGIEWALPTEEHGLAEYLPWQATVEQAGSTASVILSFEERLTGVQCQVRISLDEHAYVKIEPTLTNSTGADQQLQFWVNAAYAPGGRSVPKGTRVLLPAAQARVHDTSDPGLPTAGHAIPWPYYGPRDLSLPDQWQGFLGAFAHPGAVVGWMGAQSPGSGGLLRVFPPQSAPGAKVFGLGDIPYSRYSLEDSGYLELWGGWTPTFWDYRTLAAGEKVTWEEWWYPLPDMGPVVAANRDLALSIGPAGLDLVSTAARTLEIEAYAATGQSLGKWRAELQPGRPWHAPDISVQPAAVQVRDPSQGQVVLSWPG